MPSGALWWSRLPLRRRRPRAWTQNSLSLLTHSATGPVCFDTLLVVSHGLRETGVGIPVAISETAPPNRGHYPLRKILVAFKK